MSGATPPERTSLRLNAAKKAPGGNTPPPTNKKTKEKTKNNGESHNHTGSIMSYEDPETKRRGYGNVGKWLKDKAVYEVDFTFIDMEDPYEQLDHCPLAFVETHLVDTGMGRAWLDALKKQMATDSPDTARRRRTKRHHKTVRETQLDHTDAGPSLDGSGNNKTNKRKRRQLRDADEFQSTEDEDTQKGNSSKSQNAGKDSEPSLNGSENKTNKKRKTRQLEDDDDFQSTDDEGSKQGKSPKSKNVRNESALDPGVKALLSHAVREGIYSIQPHPDKRVKPFMSWNPKKKKSCIKMLLKRSPGIQALAEKMRRNEFATLYSTHVRTLAHNERSAQIRQLKLLYLATSDFSMVSNYDVGNSNNHMMTDESFKAVKISSTLSSEFATIKELRSAIASPKMYEYPKLFDLFCAGLESGRLRGTKRVSITPIEELITVAHEAHFRLELWYALALTRFRHTIKRTYIEERFEKHAEFCRMVAQGRRESGTAAFKHRNSAVKNVFDDNADTSSDSDDGVSQDYY